MKVYVDENDYVITYCAMTGRESLETSKSPIIVESLADYTKQVRNEVIEQVKDYIENHSHTIPIDTKNRKVIYKIGLTRFLDQLEEYNEK